MKLLLGIFILFSFSCTYHVDKKQDSQLQDGQDSGDVNFKPDSKLDFKFVKSSVLTKCLNCHTSQKRPFFSDYQTVIANLERIQGEIARDTMPPKSQGFKPLSSCQKEILSEWVRRGARENETEAIPTLAACGNLKPPAPEIPLLEKDLNYETLNTEILQKKCMVCHGDEENEDASLVFLYPHDMMLMDPEMIDIQTKDPLKSLLYKAVKGGFEDVKKMPPKKSDVKPMTDDEIEFIKRWIEAGAPK